MSSRAITVLIRHEDDSTAKHIIDQLYRFVEQGLLKGFLDVVVPAGTNQVESDLSCRVLREDGIAFDTLLNSIARVGDFDILRMGLINAGGDNQETSHDLAQVVNGIQNWLDQLLSSNVQVVDARIGIRAFAEPLPHKDFFPVTSNVNLLVIPQDRITDGGVARPLSRNDDDGGGHTLVLHGAVEVSSILGLWQGMDVSPIDSRKPMLAGSATPRLIFAQSRVRAMLGPGLPMDKVAPSYEDLPAPRNHFTVVDSSYAAESIAKVVYPEFLKFVSEPEPDFFSYRSGLRHLIPEFLREVGRIIIGIPKVMARGIQDELNAIAGEGLQEAIGSDAWVQILWAGRDSETIRGSLTNDQIQAALQAVEIQYRRELLSPLDASSWASIVNAVLGAIDGNSSWSRQRQELFGNEKLLLLKREHITSSSEDLHEIISHLEVSTRIKRSVHQETESTFLSPDSSGSNDEECDGAPSHSSSESEPGEIPVWSKEDEASFKADSDLSTARVGHDGVLSKVGTEFQLQAQAAHEHVYFMAERIRSLYMQLGARDASIVSPIFNVTIALALSVLIFVMGTCTRITHAINFEDSSPTTRDALWIGFSSVFIIGSILLLGVGGKKTWQARALLTSLCVSVYVAIIVVFFNELRDWFSNTGENVWPAVLLGFATLGLAGIAVVRSVTSANSLRRRLGRAFGITAGIYLLVGLTVWQARSDSFIGQQSSPFRSRLLWVSLIVAVLLIISCLTFVAVVVVRERNRLNSIAKSIEWARKEIVSSADAEKRLSAAAVQWITTAAVIGRVINLPLGKLNSSNVEFSGDITNDDAILKFDAARLALTDSGQEIFAASLRNNFVDRGWLSRQYEKLVRQYQIQLATRTNNSIEDVENRRPETDPEVISIDELMKGMSRAERYRFASSVYNGDFDGSLIELPEDFDLREVYQPILSDRSAYQLEGAQFADLSILEFMQQIAPTKQPRLPVGLVNRTFTSNDSDQVMKAFLWWPSEIVGELDLLANSIEDHQTTVRRDGPVTSNVALMAVRVDLSEPFLYSECGNQPVSSDMSPQSPSVLETGQTNL
jgi:hypothetical protein